MLTNLWHFIFKRKFANYTDEVLAVSDLLPMKSLTVSGNKPHHRSVEEISTADGVKPDHHGRKDHHRNRNEE